MDFYERFLKLCEENDLAPSGALTQMGFSRSVNSQWKKGVGVSPSTLGKVATFFGVSRDYMLGKTDDRGGEMPENTAPIHIEEKSSDRMEVLLLSFFKKMTTLEQVQLLSELAKKYGDKDEEIK